MKLCFVDLETTGTKHWRNGVHQIAGRIVIDGQFKDEFNINVQPNPACTIEDEALACSNTTREQLATYTPMREAYEQIIGVLEKRVKKYDKTDKYFFVAYSGSFDNDFLRAFFVQNSDNYFGSWFWSGSLDVMVLAQEYLKFERHKMPNFQLKTVATYLGIEVEEEELHQAGYDIDLTMQIYNIVTKNHQYYEHKD